MSRSGAQRSLIQLITVGDFDPEANQGPATAIVRVSARAPRWSAAPWWSPAGGGLTLRVQVGAGG